jgi:hypothetical protein
LVYWCSGSECDYAASENRQPTLISAEFQRYDPREAQCSKAVRKQAPAVARDSNSLRDAGRELPGGGSDRCADDLVGLMYRQLSPARTSGMSSVLQRVGSMPLLGDLHERRSDRSMIWHHPAHARI